jgi:hypothetical protein
MKAEACLRSPGSPLKQMTAAVNDVNIGSCIRNDHALEPDKSYQVGRYASPHCFWGLGDRHIVAYSERILECYDSWLSVVGIFFLLLQQINKIGVKDPPHEMPVP